MALDLGALDVGVCCNDSERGEAIPLSSKLPVSGPHQSTEENDKPTKRFFRTVRPPFHVGILLDSWSLMHGWIATSTTSGGCFVFCFLSLVLI